MVSNSSVKYSQTDILKLLEITDTHPSIIIDGHILQKLPMDVFIDTVTLCDV